MNDVQEPPGGWTQPAVAHPAEAYAIKRPVARVFGFVVVSFGIYAYYWFYVTRKELDGELGHGRDDALLHTLLLLVPIANFFSTYWLWRDLNLLRTRLGMSDFPVVAYLVGSVFLAPVFYCLVLSRLNEYWDMRTQGLATDAPVTTAEKAVVIAGACFWLLWLLMMVILVVVLIVAGASS